MKIRIKYFLILFLFPIILFSQDRWILLASSTDGIYDYYYDVESIMYEGSTVIVWEKTIKNVPKSSDNPANDTLYIRLKNTAIKDLSDFELDYIWKRNEMWLDYTLHKRKYYCGERKYELLYSKDVYMDGSSSSKRNLSIMNDAIPETVGEYFYLTFCNK